MEIRVKSTKLEWEQEQWINTESRTRSVTDVSQMRRACSERKHTCNRRFELHRPSNHTARAIHGEADMSYTKLQRLFEETSLTIVPSLKESLQDAHGSSRKIVKQEKQHKASSYISFLLLTSCPSLNRECDLHQKIFKRNWLLGARQAISYRWN